MELNDIAGHLLQIEQQLMAYQKLHTDELAQLWQTLNQCKRDITAIIAEPGPDTFEPKPASELSRERDKLIEEE